ncbi:MAG TPA: gamma-glutamylcyclotransferase [Peptococcaceae bacterium]|nr:gamma-glutamylcyclotransferase [Peptococcaceae bacterium]
MSMVFVYGTLMKGYENHRYYLAQAEYLGKGEIEGYALYAVSSFPGIVPEKGEKVKGELYRVDSDTLVELDILEGEGSLYLRKMVKVTMDQKTVEAWVYIWNGETRGKKKINYDDQPWKG